MLPAQMGLFFNMLLRRKLHLFFLISTVFYSILTIAQSKAPKDRNVELVIQPNPAKAFAKFKLKLKKTDIVSLEIFDSKGILIDKIYDKETLEKGIKPEKQFDRKKKEAETYTCVLTSAVDGSKFTDFLVFEEDIPTEITFANSQTGLQISPNPTSSHVDITSPGIPITSLKVHDVIGNVIINEALDLRENHKLDLSNLHPGIYFLTLQRRENTDVVRLIKTE